jgi:hypothetical protein
VRAFFHEELADKIFGVPISRIGGEDFVSWPFDKHGVYSVKSGYNLAKTSVFSLIVRQGARALALILELKLCCGRQSGRSRLRRR